LLASTVLLIVAALAGGRPAGRFAPLFAWFAAAAWLQFRGGTLLIGAVGLALQALLAIYLYVRVLLRPD
jgi:hypothetical protein